jgi:uncharacterized protein (TIGR01777 family)
MRALVLGATGFIGRHLTRALRNRGDTVVEASLRDPAAAASAAAGCHAIVNLAGEPIAQRWTQRVKERLESSRIDLPRRFLDQLARSPEQPRTYVSPSGVDYYGTSETETFDESSPPGDGFLSRVCVAWEREALRAGDLGMRVCILRTGVVLGTDGGALRKMLLPFRMGAGGVIGSGKQWLSWIHVGDLVDIYLIAIDRASGIIDATAPNPVTNAQFTHALGAALHRPTFLPTPTMALRMMLGEGVDLLLKGQRVLPKRVVEEYGYAFKYPTIAEALRNLLAA